MLRSCARDMLLGEFDRCFVRIYGGDAEVKSGFLGPLAGGDGEVGRARSDIEQRDWLIGRPAGTPLFQVLEQGAGAPEAAIDSPDIAQRVIEILARDVGIIHEFRCQAAAHIAMVRQALGG